MKVVGIAAAIAASLSLSLLSVKPVQAQDLALNLCTYVQADDRARMRQKVRDERVRLRQVYDGVLCNGMSLIQFAANSGSNDIGVFIVGQLVPSQLESNQELGWLEENGYASSEIAALIRERINQ